QVNVGSDDAFKAIERGLERSQAHHTPWADDIRDKIDTNGLSQGADLSFQVWPHIGLGPGKTKWARPQRRAHLVHLGHNSGSSGAHLVPGALTALTHWAPGATPGPIFC